MAAAVQGKQHIPTNELDLPATNTSIDQRLINLYSIVNDTVIAVEQEKSELTSELNKIKRNGEILKNEIDLLQKDLAALKACNADQSESIEALKKTIADREQTITRLKSEFLGMQTDMQQIRDSEEKHKKTITDLKAQVRDLNATVREKSNEIATLSAKILALMQSEKAKEIKLAQQEASIKSIKQDRDKLNTHISTQNKTITDLKTSTATHAKKIDSQSKEIEKLNNDLERKHQELLEVCIAAGDVEDRLYELSRPGVVGKFVNKLFNIDEFHMTHIPVPSSSSQKPPSPAKK